MLFNRNFFSVYMPRVWLHRGIVACLLWPISLLFAGLAWVRRYLYRHHYLHVTRLSVPVIVVGNIMVGGTGKTPFTIWLVKILQRMGRCPAVVSRGYGGSVGAPYLVTQYADADVCGDEPILIARSTQCVVMVGRNRAQVAQLLLELHPEVDCVILDDGLQHYALARDVEICVFDVRGVGNGWMLPAGPLREADTRQCDFVVHNVPNMAHYGDVARATNAWPMLLSVTRVYHLNDPKQYQSLDYFSGKIVALAGIGNPSRFFMTLRTAGLIFDEMPLPDHVKFAEDDPKLLALLASDVDFILMTEKDAVKCASIQSFAHDKRIWVVGVDAIIDDQLAEKILEKC